MTVMFSVAICGCGGSSKPVPSPPPRSVATTVVATMRAVDLEGKPIQGMIPIATREANAFDEPIVRGEPTKDDGTTVLALPLDQHLFLRMWDPALRHFANNFYEIQPGEKLPEGVKDVTMVEGASLDMTLPTPNAAVDIMMLHPQEGPWWPAHATSDVSGQVHFDAVPAGMFTIRIKAQPGGAAELENVKLDPSGAADLGHVPLNQ